ncbi:FtsK/SpoIIIE family DNA translocase [Holophaga foetida]|uniref:FtsK/SpoIIIE family DNA translocase n=1 Tax=Holophaga foetida TaxID=35839 RepID=UPI0002472EC1|nr:DNA translocase FtsK 4TM domain-containing protein [Holophaga foetida]
MKEGMGRLLLRVLVGAFALVLVLSLLSFHPRDPLVFFAQGQVDPTIHNLCGNLGAHLAGLLQIIAGVGSWLVPFYILWECIPQEGPRWHRRLAWAALAFAVWTALGAFGTRNMGSENGLPAIPLRWGGWIGNVCWPSMHKGLGPAGLPIVLAVLILFSCLIIAPGLTQAFGKLMVHWFGQKAWPWFKPLPAKGAQGFLGMVRRPFLGRKEKASLPVKEIEASDFSELSPAEDPIAALERAEREALDYRKSGRQIPPEVGLPIIHSMNLDSRRMDSLPMDLEPIEGVPWKESSENLDLTLPPPVLLRDLPPPPPPKPMVVESKVDVDRFGRRTEQQALGLTEPTPSRPLPPMPSPALPESPSWKPQPEHEPRRKAASQAFGPVDRLELPPRRLFDPPKAGEKLDPRMLEDTRTLIQQKLTEFKVKGQVVGMQPGPVVTVYEFAPDPGVPLAKVMNMEDDLALALQAEAVRIDRIPGRNLVGIEVPNPKRETICFREVLDSPAFRDPDAKDGGSLLTLALGKDLAGHPIVADLAKMPHLLIGGSTGSGKSVGVNAMICSILLRAMPHEAKLILVDPKMVELGIYENIPHLWAPVVTDMKEAGRVLKWVVAQMEDRYRRLALLAVRNLEGFNQKIFEAGGSIDLSDRTPNPRWPDRPTLLEHLPYVVVVIDELADLMMVARSEVEESIARIAQKARAVGIHLILATQRPSVDIVTGVIKANLPSRLSYRVNTKIDSRTILDSSGGEQLLGKGDALFLAPGTSRPRRIHAPFLTEEETLRLVDWLKERGKPDYNQALLSAMETDEEAAGAEDDGGASSGDDIYDRAVAVVKRERKASTSLLQRKLNIGYGRAARLIDRMEEEGLIGPDRGASKPREVLVGEEM